MQNEKQDNVSWTAVPAGNSIAVLFYVNFQTFPSAKCHILGKPY